MEICAKSKHCANRCPGEASIFCLVNFVLWQNKAIDSSLSSMQMQIPRWQSTDDRLYLPFGWTYLSRGIKIRIGDDVCCCWAVPRRNGQRERERKTFDVEWTAISRIGIECWASVRWSVDPRKTIIFENIQKWTKRIKRKITVLRIQRLILRAFVDREIYRLSGFETLR